MTLFDIIRLSIKLYQEKNHRLPFCVCMTRDSRNAVLADIHETQVLWDSDVREDEFYLLPLPFKWPQCKACDFIPIQTPPSGQEPIPDELQF